MQVMKSASDRDQPTSLTSPAWLRTCLWWLVDTCLCSVYSWSHGVAALQNCQGCVPCQPAEGQWWVDDDLFKWTEKINSPCFFISGKKEKKKKRERNSARTKKMF